MTASPTDPGSFLRGIWYFALPSRTLRAGRMTARMFLGEPLLFGRAADGTAFALRDICPHRAIPLSYGKFDGNEIECCYHGWRFDRSGACTAIPSTTGRETISVDRIRVRDYPVHEAQGCIWVFMPGEKRPATLPDPPHLPELAGDAAPYLAVAMTYSCHADHAVVGLVDPAHGPYVHKSWWWRSAGSIHEKQKHFGPAPLGFAMLRHRPSRNSLGYRILGGTPETEIAFRLPGIRIEHIRAGRHWVVSLTCVTPIDAEHTAITHLIFTSIGWLRPFKPVLLLFARRFLGQDRLVMARQQQGLRHEQNLLLIRDADMLARWYYQLKNEYARAQAETREFRNPVRETTLHWRT